MTKKKFKYTGEEGQIDFDLIVAGILPAQDLKTGQELEIDDKATLLDGTNAVERMRSNGLWEEMTSKRGRSSQIVEQPEPETKPDAKEE